MTLSKALFLAVIFLVLVPYVGDSDFWLHLRAGEIIAENGIFPRVDAISFTNEGREWINQAWFFQIIAYFLLKYAGFTAISVFAGLVGTLIFALIAKGKAYSQASYLFLAVVAYGLRPFIAPRPQIFAYLALLVLMLALAWHHKTGNKKIVFILPSILLFWGNVHASVILALPVFLVVFLFEYPPFKKINPEALADPERKRLLLGAALALSASLINPFGHKIYWHALHPLRFPEIYRAMVETQPIYDASLSLLIIHLLIIAVFAWQFMRVRRGIKIYETALFICFAASPFIAVKYLPFAWMAMAPVVSRFLPEWRWGRSVNNLALAFLISASIFIFLRGGNLFKNAHDEWPRRLAGFIVENNLNGSTFNPYSWSGYIAWTTKQPAFNNTTISDMGGDVFKDGLDFEKGERVDEIIGEYGLSVIISPPWMPLAYFVSVKEDWALVYWDNFGTIFIRRGSGNDETIEKYALDIRYFNDSVEGVLKKYEPNEIAGLIKNYEKAIERQPDLLLGRYRLGLIYQLSRDCSKAVEEYKKLLEFDYKLGSAHFRLAECYQKAGDLESASEEERLGGKYIKSEKWWYGRR